MMYKKIKEGEAFFSEGKIAEAKKCFWEILAQNPENKVAWNNLGVIGYQQANTPKAVVCFKQSLAIDPCYKDAMVNLYQALTSCNMQQELIPFVNCALEQGEADDDFIRIYNEITTPPVASAPRQDHGSLITRRLEKCKHYIDAGDLAAALNELEEVSDFDRQGVVEALKNKIYYGFGYPRTLLIEPTDICNLRCTGCPREIANNGKMSVEHFESIIDGIADFVKSIILHDFGESFVHPNLLEMIRYCTERRIETIIGTNGNFAVDFENLIRSGLTSLTFAVDGTTQETYEQYRVGGRLNRVLNNIRELVAAKKRLGAGNPTVVMKFIIMKTNEHQIDAVQRLAEEIGVDRLTFSPFSVTYHESEKEYFERFVPTNEEYVKEDPSYLKKGMRRRKYFGKGSPHCYGINSDSALIKWNGDVLPCCNIEYHTHDEGFRQEAVMGNVFSNGGFKAIWDSDKYRQFRKRVTLNRDSHRMCLDCSRRYPAYDDYFLSTNQQL